MQAQEHKELEVQDLCAQRAASELVLQQVRVQEGGGMLHRLGEVV